MTTKIFKYSAIALILVGVFVSCNRKEECSCIETINLPEEKICDVDNPMTDLEWLEKHINDRKKMGYITRIHLVDYKDGYCFILEVGDDCCYPFRGCDCDGTSHIFSNCDGYQLCYIEGSYGTDRWNEFSQDYYKSICRGVDYEFDFENMQLIYEYNCNH